MHGVREQLGDLRVVEPRAPCTVDPSPQARAEAVDVGRGRLRGTSGDERADTTAALDDALEVELPVGLQHRVRVDRERRDDFLHGRQLVPGGEDAEPHGLTYLLHELQVRRHAGLVETELDHESLYLAN